MRVKNQIIMLFIAAFLLLGTGQLKANQYEISRFVPPETCGDCHSEIYSQWENSMHNLSHNDPVYNALSKYLLKGLTNKDEIMEGESCVKCHTPIGVVSGNPKKLSDDESKIPDIAKKGIQCDYCHSATGAKKMFNNDLKLDPGHGEDDPGVKRGPFKDSESDFHESAYSEFHTRPEICGTCHNVKHVVYMTDLETTYDEWKNGPYNSKDPKKRITCQGCHMYQRPGIPATGSTKRPQNPGLASDDGPQREHIFTHYFVGGNHLVPGMFNETTKIKMAEERLKNAASLSIDAKEIKKGKVAITVSNTGAGHYLPSGLTDVRQMWLHIVAINKKGKTVYESGKLDNNGHISEGTIIFNTVFGDGKGNPVINISKAREKIKDKRIPPLESVKEIIILPKNSRKNVTIHVSLLYRVAPQKIIDTVLGKGKLKLPVTTMVEIEKSI